MPISQRHARWFALALMLVLAPGTAFADPGDEAKAHVAKATRAHKEGRYEEARVELEAAYALAPRPELLYALGQVDAKLGNCRDARTYFQRFVAGQNDPQVAKIVDEAIAACKPATPPAAPAEPTPPAATAAAAPAAPGAHPVWYQDTIGDSLVIGGLVFAAVGLIEYRSAVSNLDAAEDRASTTTLARYHDLVDGAHDKRTRSIVLVGAGSLLIAGGIVHYVVHDRAVEPRGVGVTPVSGGGVVSYGGRF